MRIAKLLLVLLFTSILIFAQGSSQPAKPKKEPAKPETPLKALVYTPSLDVTALDKSVNPCTDFYQFSCGGWQKNNPIPADQAVWSVYGKLNNDNYRFLWGILDDVARPQSKRNPIEAQVGDYFAACMDVKAIEKRRAAPLKSSLEAIAALTSKQQIAGVLAPEHMNGAGGMFNFGSEQDAKDSLQHIAAVYQGGLGLPDRDYYLKEDGKFPGGRRHGEAERKGMQDLVDAIQPAGRVARPSSTWPARGKTP